MRRELPGTSRGFDCGRSGVFALRSALKFWIAGCIPQRKQAIQYPVASASVIRAWLVGVPLILVMSAIIEIATTTSASAQGFIYNPQPPRLARPKIANDGQM